MRALILSATAALALAGCAGQPAPQIDTGAAKAQLSAAAAKAKAALDKVCANYQFADNVFDLLAWTGKIPQKVIDAENAAVNQIAVTCANPPNDARAVVTAVEGAWATVQKIRSDWKA